MTIPKLLSALPSHMRHSHELFAAFESERGEITVRVKERGKVDLRDKIVYLSLRDDSNVTVAEKMANVTTTDQVCLFKVFLFYQ